MKIIKSKKYNKMDKIAIKNDDPLREQMWRAIEQRFIKIRPTFEGRERKDVSTEERYRYTGRAEESNYIASQFLQSFFKDYDIRGYIIPGSIYKINNGEYDGLIEQAWHTAAQNEEHYRRREREF